MATYTLRIIQNGKSKSGTFNDNQRAQLPADPNTEYRIYDDNGNLITHPLVERQGDDLLVYANKVNDGTPELILTDYFNKNPVLNADYVADAGNTLMTNDKLAAIVPVMASEVLVKAITVGAALVIGGVILSLFDDNDGNGSNNNQNTKVTDLAAPAITIAPIATITNKNGTTTLTGTMALNNENVDSATVTLVVNGTAYPATISPDNQSWTAEVPNDVLAQTEGSSPIVAHITISKNGVSKTANNAENTATPVSDTENVTSFTVDTTVGTPVITIQDVPNIVKGQDTDSQIYTLSGTLDNIDADATPTVTVKINDTVITQTVNVAADKKTWSVDVEGKLLAEKLGDNQTVVASVIVVDTNGNTATAQTPADLYNVSAPAQTLNTPYITVTPLPEINSTNGSTPVSGTLDLNNENLDKATVTVSINGGAPVEAKISDDKKSWTVDVDNATLIGDKNAPHNIVATVDIAKGEQAAQSTNTDNDRDTDPAVNNGSFTVDNTISTPEITINDVPNIEKGKQNDTYPISGSLKNIDADATPTVIVTVNGKPHTATVSADKKTWSVNVSGSDLAAKVGDNQKVTATVSVKDGMGNTATAAKAAEDAYNVTEPAPAAALNKPYITVTPLAEIKDKTGSTPVSGKLDLNNENLDKATVTVSINGSAPVEAKISDDKKSWTVDVDNATLIGDKNAPHNIVATVNIAKGDQTEQSTNIENDRDTDPSVNNGNFTVDNHVNTPEITINDVPNIEKGKEEASYTLSGSLKNIDADATATVMVSIDGQPAQQAKVEGNIWTLEVNGADLAATTGAHAVSASVIATDNAGNTAMAETPAETAYNVTEPAPVTPTALNEPYITVTPIAPITQANKDGKTTLTGKLDLNNENLDSQTVTVSINGGEPVTANISDDKKSWTLEVDNATLIGDKEASHKILAEVHITKNNKKTSNSNVLNENATPEENMVDFVVDTELYVPKITIDDVPDMLQYKTASPVAGLLRPEEYYRTLSGKLINIGKDDKPVVTVEISGKPITQEVTISEDKTTWKVRIPAGVLSEKLGENEVVAKLGIEDTTGKVVEWDKAQDPFIVQPSLEIPDITVTPLTENITQANQNGKTRLEGKLSLNNDDLDSATVEVKINYHKPITATIAEDKQSWYLEVDNSVLIDNTPPAGTTILSPRSIFASVTITKGDEEQSNNSSLNEKDPQGSPTNWSSTGLAEIVDIELTQPTITINPVPSIEKGKEQAEYELSGSLNNVDSDVVRATVTVTVNGKELPAEVNLTAKTWALKVAGSELAAEVGEKQVSATVTVVDDVGNTATAEKPAEYTYNVTVTAPAEPKITFDTLGHDVFSGRSETKTISGKATGLPNNAKIEVTVAGKVYDASLSGDTWSITIPASDLQEKGEKEVVASIKVANDVVASSDKGSFFVMTPSIAITSAPPSINSSNLSNKTIISGTYDADGVDRKVISINIGQMMDMEFPNGLILQVYDDSSTVTTYKTTDANNVIKLDEANKTWSIELDNSVLAHQVGSPETLAVQAYIEAYENYPNASEPVSRSNGQAQGYTSEVVAPQTSPYIISNLIEDDTSNLANIISSVIDVSVAENHSVSGSDGIQDTFVFSKMLDGSIAQIANFNADEDKLQLNSEVFTALSNTMSDFADYVQYNAATGALSYDADGAGAGAATQLAQLSKDLEIDQSNFIIA